MRTETLAGFIRVLRARKVLGVALTYIVAGFGLIEGSDVILPRLQLSPQALDILVALVLFGFPVALLVAWIVGSDNESEQVGPDGGRPDRRGGSIHRLTLPLLSLALVTAVSGWLGIRVLRAEGAVTGPADETAELPLVVMMDSPHPLRVYDEETRAANGTNADVISDILLDLPIRRQREAIGPEWHRDEEILHFDPDLIVIHYSGFRQEDGSGPRERLKLLISFFVESKTRFLVYSRAPESLLEERMDELLADLEEAHPGIVGRVDVFGLDDYGPRSWLSPLTANALKLRVKEILGL